METVGNYMKIRDIDVIYKLKNQQHITYNLWFSSLNKGYLIDFRNYNDIRISILIVERHLN